MLSKTSVDEVFMHHFEKMLSLPLGSCPWTLLGDFRPSDPFTAYPWKKSCGRPWCAVKDYYCRCSCKPVRNWQRWLHTPVLDCAGTQQVVVRLSGPLLPVRRRQNVRCQLLCDVAVPLWTDWRPLYSGVVEVWWRERLSRRLRWTAELP